MAFSGALVCPRSLTTAPPQLIATVDLDGPERFHFSFSSLHQARRAAECTADPKGTRSRLGEPFGEEQHVF